MSDTWIVEAGQIALAITAVVTLVALVLCSPVGRWLVRQVREDAEEHRLQQMRRMLDVTMPGYLAPVLYELRVNGGGSFRDQIVSRLERIEQQQKLATRDREDLRGLIEDFAQIDGLGREPSDRRDTP